MLRQSLILSGVCLLSGLLAINAEEPRDSGPNKDWPQWQGPTRDSISIEKGLLSNWPADGPPLVWRTEKLGMGYSTPVVAGGKIYGMGRRGEQEGVWALEESTGKELWFAAMGLAPGAKDIGFNDGPRCSVTVDGDLLYALTCNGDFACIQADTQKTVWKTNFKKNLGGKVMSMWGFSESPLIDGGKVIATPGGDQNTVVAFDKKSGSVLWRSNLKDGGGAGYGSPVIMTVGGKKMYLTWLGKCLAAVDAETGAECWRYAKTAGKVANIPTPIVLGDKVFCTTGYTQFNGGSALLQISRKGNQFDVKEVWHHDSKGFMNHHGGVVLVNGYFYGGHGQNQGLLSCIDMKTGKIQYKNRGVGQGSAAVVYADGHLYYRYQDGTMALVKVNPNKDEVVSKFKLPVDSGKPSWPHPIICNGKMYIRDMDVLLCFNVKQE